MKSVLQVQDLEVQLYRPHRGYASVVCGVDLNLVSGEILGLVGESGSGKSQTAAAILGLTPPNGRVRRGKIEFSGLDLLALNEAEWRNIRGARISLIPQEAVSALNPCLRIKTQVSEILQAHAGSQMADFDQRIHQLLEEAGLADSSRVADSFPHELSGGMRQRVLIAIALACNPEVLLADEATTALDAITQRHVLQALANQVRRRNAAMLMITHDLVQARWICDRVAVMYAGRVVEEGPTERLFSAPRHPYTRGLLSATLPIHRRRDAVPEIPGRPPSFWESHQGCPFSPRCDRSSQECEQVDPEVTRIEPERSVRCHHPLLPS